MKKRLHMKKRLVALSMVLVMSICHESFVYADEKVCSFDTSVFVQKMNREMSIDTFEDNYNKRMVSMSQNINPKDKEKALFASELLNYYAIPIQNVETLLYNSNELIFQGMNEKNAKIMGKISFLKNGSVLFDIDEEGIKNTIEFTKENDMYLDGNKVTFSVEITKENEDESTVTTFSERIEKEIGIRANGSDRWMTTSCPYGKSMDYSDYQFTAKVRDVRLGKTLDTISNTALKIILHGMAASLSAETGLWGFVSAEIVWDIIDDLKDLADVWDQTTDLSFKSKVYYHKKGHIVGNLFAVHKEKQTWYSNANFGGNVSSERIVYACRQYY